MDKPTYLGFAVLELSELHLYETYYDKLQQYFGQENYSITLYLYGCFRFEYEHKRYYQRYTKFGGYISFQ